MTRSLSLSDLVLAMYEFCGWFSIFKPSASSELALNLASSDEASSSTEKLFELDETQDEPPWKRVYVTARPKSDEMDRQGEEKNNKDREKGTSLWMRKPLIEIEEL